MFRVRSITIPEGVTTIDRYAFYQCENLTAVTIPASVKSILTLSFHGCTNLTSVTFGGTPPNCIPNAFGEVTACGYYHMQNHEEWLAQIDENGEWNGLEMKQIEDPFPSVKTEEEVAAVLKGAKDSRLGEQIKTVAEYERLLLWMVHVTLDDFVERQKLMDSELTWFRYAIDSYSSRTKAPESLAIKTIKPAKDGGWDLTVSIDDVYIGSAAIKLETIFTVEGAADLNEESFSSNNVETTFSAVGDSLLRVSARPKSAAGQFFIRVKMTP